MHFSLFRHGWSDRSTSTMVSLDAWLVGRFMIVVSALISVALLVVYQNKSSEMPKKLFSTGFFGSVFNAL